ncbi:vasoactive intestinal polypeptide receptor 2 isoform X2 [Fukomys damarensis]|uniref:vasoactive intestinal polypeptide receptor 2 isoform X2 n=1 Tax=Fukomys damarensis TaxID=885580 RepID=UPI0005402F47|nr:vasoactive intestinal polypeptide receptor 2 isoform X2 [Fukomys damarensis]
MRAPALLTCCCCCWLLVPVNSIHPECQFHLEIQEEETKCAELLSTQTEKHKACPGIWDNLTCWQPADLGETVTVPCPVVFSNFYSKSGNISKNCTSDGWSETFPDFIDACGYNDSEDESKITFYILVKAIYTLGYSVSLMSLATGSIILCLFRKLHCTRNYIHLNLFLSFILRAVSVLVKDDILYSSSGTLHCLNLSSSWGFRMLCTPEEGRRLVGRTHCSSHSSCVSCKLSLVFFQYCIMANFYWLLVEGLYLHTLLVAIFSPSRCFLTYMLIGWAILLAPEAWFQPQSEAQLLHVLTILLPRKAWHTFGIPTICIGVWTAARLSLENTGCWDTNNHSVPWWVIRTPILVSILVNFVLFISIVRILLQKLTSPDVGGNDQSQYKLAKSTLLLIPLFGVHYMVFAAFPIGISSQYQILFELCVGSFQGLVVAVLYCFLNSEVQCELKRRWHSLCLTQPGGRNYRLHSWSISRHGSESALQMHRGSRTQSFLQTETSVM